MTGDPLGPDALDFWIGDWTVSWEGGGHGTNTIRRILDDRVIEESFDGQDADSALKGRSLSVRDNAGRWRQTWVDSTGAYLELEGAEVDGRIAFQRPATIDGAAVLQRMVWLDVTADSLRWQWQRSTDDGRSWETTWEIQYRRAVGDGVMRTEDGLLVVGASEGLAGPGDIVVKLQATETGGRWGVAVVSGVPGEGGRTHVHVGEPEGFFLLEGEIELLGASSRTPIGAGTFVLVPPDTEHGLRIVGSRPARWLAIWPAALDGLVEELLTIDRDDVAAATLVRRRHGILPGRDRS